ncbi:glycoside hydrolase family 3 C-terminal domain-containing protein [Brochothrix campestris]|uniref:Glycoside hydrolase n=1 Tax=Brochothrix campestris FSL F6-1037 TaxID=1265861 RepID=W7D2G3_9LIST|nr:glycoside hydrolase family 3 C-terminal domain-containing protein [Brochothrix campestris]EUJ42106.1 glycoside hydrolase [Brochothrix campestris FSL F6-1037]
MTIKQIVSQLTLAEKASLCSGQDFWHLKGIERLNLPSIMVTDGPHGLRKQRPDANDHLGVFDSVPAICFPSAAGMAASWNKALLFEVGEALGEACVSEQISVLLGPGVNIKRSPLCGRNFEYFSEDPLLAAQLATQQVKGIQTHPVGTSLKHFAVNNQEERRMTIDARVDERSLREIYLAAFEAVVKEAQPATVMSSYNRVNGEYASESERLLTTILRDEWGFEGAVVSDWGAVNHRVAALKAGLELDMPANNGYSDSLIVAAVEDGSLDEAVVDQAAERVLRLIEMTKPQANPAPYDLAAHHQLARRVASESMVLLKNEADLLPLSKERDVVIIGELAQTPRYQGSGSSKINPTMVETIRTEMQSAAPLATVSYAQGYELATDDSDEGLIAEAVAMATTADQLVVVLGLPDRYESEGYDRQHLRLPANQLQLIERLSAVNERIVVVLSNGAPIEMPWIDKVDAVLEAYLGGQAAGGAVSDLLYGDVNPSGKLAETFPLRLADTPAHLNFPGANDVVDYNEGLFVGYRYYEAKAMETLFPFGHGLSYTQFDYQQMSVNRTALTDEETVEVAVTIANSGARAGQEIVQLYVQDLQSTVIRPLKELKAFTKVRLAPGETKTVTLTLDKRAFSYYDVSINDWHVETGEFALLVGRSSAVIELRETVHVTSTQPLPVAMTRNSTVGDIMCHPATRETAQHFFKQLEMPFNIAEMDFEAEALDLGAAMLKNMPLRGIVSFSQGQFSEEQLAAFLNALNAN